MSTKNEILDELHRAKNNIPRISVPDLPGQKNFPEVPEWHDFEHSVWSSGEKIRGFFQRKPKLRSDLDLQKSILEICKNRNAKRGRQSFVLLLGSPKCVHLAEEIVSLIDDNDVYGHVISALIKMKAAGYTERVEFYTDHKVAWVRNKAKAYVEKYGHL